MKNKKIIISLIIIFIVVLIGSSVILMKNKKEKKDINNQIQETIKKENKSSNFELKEVSIKQDEEYTIDLFIDKDKSDKSLTFSFEKEEMGNYKDVNEYIIVIIATDEEENITTKETKLIIKAKEKEDTTTSVSENSKPNTNNNSSSSSTTKPVEANKPSGTTTPSTQPVSDDLYYNIYHPNGIKNPKLTGKSEAEHNSIYNSGGIVNPNNGDIHKVVSSFDAQIGGSYTVAYVDEYYDKSQNTFKGYYAEGRVYVKSTVSLMVPDPTNPYYNSLTYKEDGNGRLVGTWYYTNASGSKQWLWNPNNLHF